MSLLALIQARDEERFLPGWLENIAPGVDGIIALDDGSRDRTPDILRAHPKVVEVLQNPPGAPWDERANQVALVRASRRHGASWLLCIDADERLERSFGARVRPLVADAEREGIAVLRFQLRELWGDRGHYRVDGPWRDKTRHRLFRNDPTHRRFDPRPLHRFWMPLELVGQLTTASRDAGLNLYHLRMIAAHDRAERVEKYEALDPEHLYQKVGYQYLNDERGLALEAVPPDRDFLPLDDPAAGPAPAVAPAAGQAVR